MRTVIAGLMVAAGVAGAAEPSREGAELIGKPAPPFVVDGWLNGKPDTRGKAMLVRLWTVGCFNCRDSAPALTDFARRYGPRGLVVIGVHHPKSPRAHEDSVVRAQAKEWGMDFPIAQDREWRTVKSWWTNVKRAKTSATFLVDGRGVIRYLHPGGAFHASAHPKHAACDTDRAHMEAEVQKVLSERMIASVQ